jgi:hypothetical protein
VLDANSTQVVPSVLLSNVKAFSLVWRGTLTCSLPLPIAFKVNSLTPLLPPLTETCKPAAVIIADGCSAEKVSARLGKITEEPINVQNITATLYPNPNNGEFTLAYDLKQTPEATINISDITGNIVYTIQITNETNLININTNDLRSGMYFIQLYSKGALLWTNKVMISK